MLNCFEVSTKNLSRGDSLVPEYYYYLTVVKENNIKRGMKYINLGKFHVSDGEHSAIPRNDKDGIRYLYGRNIREGCIDFDHISDLPFIDEEDYEKIPRIHLKQNDVLIPIVGTIGKSAIYKEEYVGIAGIPRHIAHITIPEKSEITPEYLSVFFRSKYGKVQLYSLTTGNIQPLLSLTNLKSVDVPIASNELMEKITKNEEEANKLLIESQKLLDQAFKIFYDSLGFDIKKIKGEFSFVLSSKEILEKNIWTPNHYNTMYKDIHEALKSKLKLISLGEITDSNHGVEVGSENYNEYIDKSANDIPFIRTSDLVNYEVDLYPDFYVAKEIYDGIKNLPKKNDVLLTKDGKIGATAMITGNDLCIISSGTQMIRLNEYGKKLGLSQEYLFVVLSVKEVGYYEALKRTVVAATIPHLRPERMKEIEIPILDKKNIDKISKLVSDAFELKNQRKPLLKENDLLFETYFK